MVRNDCIRLKFDNSVDMFTNFAAPVSVRLVDFVGLGLELIFLNTLKKNNSDIAIWTEYYA